MLRTWQTNSQIASCSKKGCGLVASHWVGLLVYTGHSHKLDVFVIVLFGYWVENDFWGDLILGN